MCQLGSSVTGAIFMSKLEELREQKSGKLILVYITSDFDFPTNVPAIIYFSESLGN